MAHVYKRPGDVRVGSMRITGPGLPQLFILAETRQERRALARQYEAGIARFASRYQVTARRVERGQ